MRVTIAAALLFAVLQAPAHAQQAATSPLPPGEGRDIVAVACTQCHAASVFTQMRMGPDAWRHMTYDMVLRGAQVQPAELGSVVTYLTSHFGPGVDVPPPMGPTRLPEGEGKVLVEQLCTLCHGLDRAAGTVRRHKEWDLIMARMIYLGTPVAGEQLSIITAYLKEKVGRP